MGRVGIAAAIWFDVEPRETTLNGAAQPERAIAARL